MKKSQHRDNYNIFFTFFQLLLFYINNRIINKTSIFPGTEADIDKIHFYVFM